MVARYFCKNISKAFLSGLYGVSKLLLGISMWLLGSCYVLLSDC